MITLFSWGYYGWGNYTPQLVKAVDEVARGGKMLGHVPSTDCNKAMLVGRKSHCDDDSRSARSAVLR